MRERYFFILRSISLFFFELTGDSLVNNMWSMSSATYFTEILSFLFAFSYIKVKVPKRNKRFYASYELQDLLILIIVRST